ncbi:hypothetical protein ASD07_29635 [Duganella sp. Root336D2]|nr:hypothetical protein ASD07_29635 [Duganella sp. Root336D2]
MMPKMKCAPYRVMLSSGIHAPFFVGWNMLRQPMLGALLDSAHVRGVAPQPVANGAQADRLAKGCALSIKLGLDLTDAQAVPMQRQHQFDRLVRLAVAPRWAWWCRANSQVWWLRCSSAEVG